MEQASIFAHTVHIAPKLFICSTFYCWTTLTVGGRKILIKQGYEWGLSRSQPSYQWQVSCLAGSVSVVTVACCEAVMLCVNGCWGHRFSVTNGLYKIGNSHSLFLVCNTRYTKLGTSEVRQICHYRNLLSDLNIFLSLSLRF